MHSHPVGLDVWFLVGPFVYFHTSCVRTAKALTRLRGCAGSPKPSLVAYVISSINSWAGSNDCTCTELFLSILFQVHVLVHAATKEISSHCLLRSKILTKCEQNEVAYTTQRKSALRRLITVLLIWMTCTCTPTCCLQSRFLWYSCPVGPRFLKYEFGLWTLQ